MSDNPFETGPAGERETLISLVGDLTKQVTRLRTELGHVRNALVPRDEFYKGQRTTRRNLLAAVLSAILLVASISTLGANIYAGQRDQQEAYNQRIFEACEARNVQIVDFHDYLVAIQEQTVAAQPPERRVERRALMDRLIASYQPVDCVKDSDL